MASKWFPKDPQDVRDYWIDFTSLLAEGETLSDESVSVPDDQDVPVVPYELLAKDSSSISDDEKWVVARFSGGSPGKYPIQYHVTTSAGQEFDLTKTLEVKERKA
jgi:hypothetical protein